MAIILGKGVTEGQRKCKAAVVGSSVYSFWCGRLINDVLVSGGFRQCNWTLRKLYLLLNTTVCPLLRTSNNQARLALSERTPLSYDGSEQGKLYG